MPPLKAETAEFKGFAHGAASAGDVALAISSREIDLGPISQSEPGVGSLEAFALVLPGRMQPRARAFEVLANEDSEWPDPDELDDAGFNDDRPGDGEFADSDLEPGDLEGSDLEDADFDEGDFEDCDFADAFDEPEDEPEFDFDWNDDDL